MERYSITQENSIVLYGFNQYTKLHIKKLLENGYSVKAIIDKRANELNSYYGIQFIESIENLENPADVCVFIMLQNALQHYEIAKELYENGVGRILFVPMSRKVQDHNLENELIMKYNDMLLGNYEKLVGIPICKEIFKESDIPFVETKIDLGDGVVAFVPVEMIFTTRIEPEGYDNIPISAFQPYHDLIHLFCGKDTDISEYMRLFGMPDCKNLNQIDRNAVLDKRKALIDYFEYEINRGMDYFVASAPVAEWNETGYFNLKEGQHRSVYLLNRNLRKIPVRITKGELDNANRFYNECNDKKVDYKYILDVQKYFGKNKMQNMQVFCSESVDNLEKISLRNLGAVIHDEYVKEIVIIFDSSFLFNNCGV